MPRTLIISRHDDIAKLLGVHAKSFENTYAETFKDIKRTVLEYVKTLRGAGARVAGVAIAGADNFNNCIEIDTEGFPLAPDVKKLEKAKAGKKVWEILFRSYLAIHYNAYICR